MDNSCQICGASASFLVRKDDYDHYKCSKCGLIFVWPIPSITKLRTDVYSEQSGYQKGKSINDGGTCLQSWHIKRIFSYLRASSPHIDKGKTDLNRKLLDVGCSNGDFLSAAKEDGFIVAGVELNQRTASQAVGRGLDVYVGTLDEARFSPNSFDVINLGDVIEHVPNPRALIKECQRILKQGGLLVISTPNSDCFWSKITYQLWRIFGIPWSVLTPPHHLHFFNPSNLDILLGQGDLNLASRWFEQPPRLMYELGNTHLWGSFRRNKSFGRLVFLILGFGVYSVCYLLNLLVSSILNSNFGSVGVYKK